MPNHLFEDSKIENSKKLSVEKKNLNVDEYPTTHRFSHKDSLKFMLFEYSLIISSRILWISKSK